MYNENVLSVLSKATVVVVAVLIFYGPSSLFMPFRARSVSAVHTVPGQAS